VHYPAALEVRTRISKIGNKSATILADIYRKGEDKPVVTSNGVMVWFDFVQQRASLIPEDVRQKIVVFEHVVEQL
jgi:acyl-CoA thioester hydrolase